MIHAFPCHYTHISEAHVGADGECGRPCTLLRSNQHSACTLLTHGSLRWMCANTMYVTRAWPWLVLGTSTAARLVQDLAEHFVQVAMMLNPVPLWAEVDLLKTLAPGKMLQD